MHFMIKNLSISQLYCVVFTLILYIFYIVPAVYSFEPAQVVTITKEDILNAKPTVPDVVFTQKQLRIIEMLEKRHFMKTFPDLSDKERLRNLEFELLGRAWAYTDTEKRIKTLKIASSNVMLQGVSLPASISSKRNAKRMTNDSIQIRKKDDVGLIDGMLRLINPELYKQYRNYSDSMYNAYEY